MHKLAVYVLMLIAPISLAGADQHAIVKNFQMSVSNSNSGAAGYNITGTIHFELSQDDFNKSGDKNEKIYVLSIYFKERGKIISSNPGFEKVFGDELGKICLTKHIKLTLENIYDYDFTFFLPASAFNLSEGQHTLACVINLTDIEISRSILRKEKVMPVIINIPPLIKVNLWVKHILVDSLDADGNLWDYFILNPIESNPDIVWNLTYAGRTYFSSKVVRNVFEYSDEHKNETYNITISKGDTLNIEVKDLDDLTPDDIIGTLAIPSKNLDYHIGKVMTAKVGQIRSIEYTLSILP